jgi:hypothetical protein
VSIRNRKSFALAASMLAIVTGVASCSWLKHAPKEEYVAVEDETPRAATPASIQISYAQPTDTLQSVIVTQYTGANVLLTSGEGDAQESIIRFDGGVPVWKFHANRNLLNPLNDIGKTPFRVDTIHYGQVPKGFVQDTPEVGPPPPLAQGAYYVFQIKRASGATSYQAARVKSDFSIQAYDAEPRAGTSFKLCCDVSSDFSEPSPTLEEPANLPATNFDSDQP